MVYFARLCLWSSELICLDTNAPHWRRFKQPWKRTASMNFQWIRGMWVRTSVPVSYPSFSLEMKASALAALAAAFTSSMVQSFSPYSMLYLSEPQNSSGLWETDATWRTTHSAQQQAAKHVVLTICFAWEENKHQFINAECWSTMTALSHTTNWSLHYLPLWKKITVLWLKSSLAKQKSVPQEGCCSRTRPQARPETN